MADRNEVSLRRAMAGCTTKVITASAPMITVKISFNVGETGSLCGNRHSRKGNAPGTM